MILNILNNKSVWKLLALVSYSPGAGYIRKEIKKLLDWNNLSLDRALKKLEFYKILQKSGRIIKLNYDNPKTEELLEIVKEDKKRLNYPNFELFVILHEFVWLSESPKIDKIYLFGSHAKKTASLNSDIDIAVFSYSKISLVKAKEHIKEKYRKEVQVHYFRPKEKSKLVNEVFKHGVRIV